MGGREARSGMRGLAAAIGLAAACVAAGCASAAKSDPAPARPLPPQAIAPPSSADSAAGEAPAPAPRTSAPPREAAPQPSAQDSSIIVIDPVGEDAAARPPSLAEAAARERQRRRTEAPPVAVITNANLADYAAKGVLTVAESDAETAEANPEEAATPTVEEAYWRQRGLEIRKRWREAVDRIPDLSAKSEELRQRFYAMDDPAVRDGQIKPEWDRSLANLDEARYQAERGAEEVRSFLEEGRRAGALPGWLREGAELEPEPVVETVDDAEQEPGEPPSYDAEPLNP